MPNDSLFFEDDLETAERARRRGNRLLERPFQPTPLDVALGDASPERIAQIHRDQARALGGEPPLAPPQAAPRGPLPLTLNGHVLDENTVTSARELASLRDNPDMPQLVMGRVMVSSPTGRVRVLPEPGEDPAEVARFTPRSLLPGAPAPKPISAPATSAAPPAGPARVASAGAPSVTRASFTPEPSHADTAAAGGTSLAADRLRLLQNDEGNALSRPLINARRRLMNTLEDLSEMKMERSVGERLGGARQDFGEFFVKDVVPLVQNNIGPVIESLETSLNEAKDVAQTALDVAEGAHQEGAGAFEKSLKQDLPVLNKTNGSIFDAIDDVRDSLTPDQLLLAFRRAAREYVGGVAYNLSKRAGVDDDAALLIEAGAEAVAEATLYIYLIRKYGKRGAVVGILKREGATRPKISK